MSLTWCLPGQGSILFDLALFLCLRERILVLAIWYVEMANILGLKRRDGNLSENDLANALNLLAELPIETSSFAPTESLEINLDRISRFRISAYDAIYLELALATRSQLATYDKAMARAAKVAGVKLFTSE